jgi:hypothetical protein
MTDAVTSHPWRVILETLRASLDVALKEPCDSRARLMVAQAFDASTVVAS